jgi:hypothetical protein
MKRLVEKTPFFLFLLPLFIVVHIEKEFYELYSYNLMYSRLAFLFLLPLFMFGFFRLFTRQYKKMALMALAFCLYIFYFGEIRYWLTRKFPNSLLSGYGFLLPVLLLIALFFIIRIYRSKKNFNRSFLFINAALTLFIVGDLIQLFARLNVNQSQKTTLLADYKPCDTCAKPDIYYLLFDCYTSSQMLKQEFGYDNAVTDSFLTQKGFRIIRQSKSNYNLTPFSMSSCFNMDYLGKGIHINTDYYLRDYVPALKYVYNSQLFPMLEKEGYDIVNHSIFNIRNHPTTAKLFDIWDIARLYDQYNLFKKAYIDLSWHLPRSLQFNIDDSRGEEYALNRDRHDSIVLKQILQTAATTPGKQPRFVYTHFLVPHTPFTFDSTGKRIGVLPVMNDETEKKAYLNQTIYVNGIMRRVIDSIFAHAKRPLVVIVQGDHGYRYSDLQQQEKEFPNLSAYYFSNGDYRQLNDSMSNVNTFRAVFNTFLGKRYPFLENRHYFLHYK